MVRLAISGSVTVKYARAIYRFKTGCLRVSFLEWSCVSASALSLACKLRCLPVVVSPE